MAQGRPIASLRTQRVSPSGCRREASIIPVDVKHRTRKSRDSPMRNWHLRSGPSGHPKMTKSGSLRRFAPNISNSQGNSDVPIADAHLRPATRSARVVHEPFAQENRGPGKQRAQGMPGAQCTRSLAREKNKAHERRHHGHTGFTRHSLRNGFNGLFRALPGDRLYCHRHQRIWLCPRPVRPTSPPLDLTPASRRQDHTTSPSAHASFVSVPSIAHRP
jgi:hypothetical protein